MRRAAPFVCLWFALRPHLRLAGQIGAVGLMTWCSSGACVAPTDSGPPTGGGRGGTDAVKGGQSGSSPTQTGTARGGATGGTASIAGTTGQAGGPAGRGGSDAGGNAGSSGGGIGGAAANAGAGRAGGGAGGNGASATGVAGTGGSAAGGAAGGVGGVSSSACNPGPPTPAAGGAAFPFPQHRFSANAVYPAACKDADVQAGWTKYKQTLIVDGGDGSLRVRRPGDSNDTVSEGISYGLLFSVYMNEKDTFDKLWKYEQKFLDSSGLMNWHINSDGSVAGRNSATDADEDIGFALVMADKQWGGYTATAKAYLAVLSSNDFQSDGTIKGGDMYVAVNPSYLAPAFYRAFAAYTGDTRWTTILDRSYDILNGAANSSTGLVPDWSTGGGGGNYSYDATRTPFRLALDAAWNDEPRAKALDGKMAAFFAGVGVANIKDGYHLDGTPTGTLSTVVFIGPAGVGGMVANQKTLVSDSYARVATDLAAGNLDYYGFSWALFSALIMTGNYVNFAAL